MRILELTNQHKKIYLFLIFIFNKFYWEKWHVSTFYETFIHQMKLVT